jgi:hypothetical protein
MENDTETYLREVVAVVYDRSQWRVLMNTLMTPWVP